MGSRIHFDDGAHVMQRSRVQRIFDIVITSLFTGSAAASYIILHAAGVI
jgi:hypothetical protein